MPVPINVWFAHLAEDGKQVYLKITGVSSKLCTHIAMVLSTVDEQISIKVERQSRPTNLMIERCHVHFVYLFPNIVAEGGENKMN